MACRFDGWMAGGINDDGGRADSPGIIGEEMAALYTGAEPLAAPSSQYPPKL